MGDYEHIHVINEGLESKTTKSGKTRFSIRIEAEPVFINTDPKALGAPVAQAIAHHLKQKMLGITAQASKNTMRARKAAEVAIQAGKSWAMKRYSGGRIGSMPPNTSDRAFNDSGRFAASIVATAAKDDSWRVNVAANRLDPQTGNVDRIWKRLVELVPAFGDIGALLQESDIVRARIRAQEAMISKGRKTAGKASAIDVAKAALKLIKTASGIVAA